MLKKKKNSVAVIKEVFQHIVLIIVAFIVLLPITEVALSGFRKNQAIFGPHIGLIPIIDTNQWVDLKEPDRRANIIKKKILINRFTQAIEGMSFSDIMDLELKGKLKANMGGNQLAKQVKSDFRAYVKSNGKEDKKNNFLESFFLWEAEADEDIKGSVREIFFLTTYNDDLRFVYEERFTFNNFKIFFTGVGVPDSPTARFPMFTWFLNSIFISGTVALLQLVVTALAGYALSRFNFVGKKVGLMTILTIQVFPGTMAMVALYLLLLYLGNITPLLGLNSKLGLILIYLGGGIPFNMWLVKGYFDTVPKALEESAMIDGATPWQAFVSIILPLVRPILAVVTILAFVGMYNEFVLAAVILTSQDNFTLPVGLQAFIQSQGAMNTRFGIFSAASFVGSLPIVVLWLMLQNQIISGLTGGSVKG
jgi:ABC-type maltose transport system permease subunit